MKGTKLLGAVLLALGILAVAYGGFGYTKKTDEVNLGPIHFEVKDRERVNIPLWAGVLVAIVGGVLLARKD
jgi:hypothetical protein